MYFDKVFLGQLNLHSASNQFQIISQCLVERKIKTDTLTQFQQTQQFKNENIKFLVIGKNHEIVETLKNHQNNDSWKAEINHGERICLDDVKENKGDIVL